MSFIISTGWHAARKRIIRQKVRKTFKGFEVIIEIPETIVNNKGKPKNVVILNICHLSIPECTFAIQSRMIETTRLILNLHCKVTPVKAQ
jgi:hypothetical protein